MCPRSPEQPRLPYPTKIIYIQGDPVEEYIIPDDQRQAVLEMLYPFIPLPDLDDEVYDLHSDKLFRVREFRVLREHGMNWLVSPYYEEGGGTVIDWMPPSFMQDDDGDDEDEWDEDQDVWPLPDTDQERSDWVARDDDYWA